MVKIHLTWVGGVHILQARYAFKVQVANRQRVINYN